MNLQTLFHTNEIPTLEEYLRRCGVKSKNYINPTAKAVESYEHYDNIHQGVLLLEKAMEECNDGKHIILVCDSDCDGYCSTALAYQFLINHGVSTHDIDILFHSKKQHGFTQNICFDINNLIKEYGANIFALIWMPDAGTNDVEACGFYSKCFNIPVLITDHHIMNREDGNPYATLINNQTSMHVKNRNLCGAGVTHKLITAYCNTHNSKFHQSVLDLVALATIGDVMDMRNLENRMIVKWGLSHINNSFLRVMCDTFISDLETTPTTLAWNVIPKINAVCRSNDMDLKTELFDALAMDYYDKTLIQRIAECHKKQRDETNRLYERALKIKPVGDNVKIFEFENTPYTGLIANKLSEYYNCPCIVVHPTYDGNYIGSLRSPCPMRSQLQKSGLMTICAGHEQSCGVGWHIEDTKQLSSFCRQLNLTPTPKKFMCSMDNILIPKEIFELNEQGKDIWGTNIPEPTIHVSNITLNGKDIKELGANKTTIKFLYGDVEFIGFFMNKEKKQSLNVGKDIMMTLEIIGTPTINTFRDKDTKQIVIKEWEICQK